MQGMHLEMSLLANGCSVSRHSLMAITPLKFRLIDKHQFDLDLAEL